MLPSNLIGKKFEAIAVEYLKKEGYSILTQNYTNVLGEIDIICRKDNYLVFIEVKYRLSGKFGRPIEAINKHKIMKMRQTATLYLKQKNMLNANVRFDAIEIFNDEIRHLENIF